MIQVNESHENTDIAFSPSIIGGGQLILYHLFQMIEETD